MKNGRLDRIAKNDRGAIILMGIPMVFFMIGMLYFVVGIGESIVARERLQDAADAGAFSAAIMHARGMNMIALVNQVMAALVALLVMVRLFQALMLAAAAVATALAFWTAGSSLAFVPPTTQAAAQAQQAFDKLRQIINPMLTGLHVFELGIKYSMPVAAEARVIDTVVGHYSPPAAFGFAIPGSYPLPVKPGKWPELCGKAGEYAGEMITFPFDAVLGDNIISQTIGGGISAMAEEFSSVFCSPDGGNQTPSLSIPDELPEIKVNKEFESNRPVLASVSACQNAAPDLDLDERERICDQAALDEARAKPNKQDGGPKSECTYTSAYDQLDRSCEPCFDRISGKVCQPYLDKVNKAASECNPSKKEENKIESWNYPLRDYNWRANLVPVPLPPPAQPDQPIQVPDDDDRMYTIEFVSKEPIANYSYHEYDERNPCGDGGYVSTGYNPAADYQPIDASDRSRYLCEQQHYHPDVNALTNEAGDNGLALRDWKQKFDDRRWEMEMEPYEPPRPQDLPLNAEWPPFSLQPPFVPEERPFFVGNWKAVPFMHSCGATVDTLDKVDFEPPPTDEGVVEQTDTGACGKGQMLHHEMEDGVVLGSETFQLRALVVAGEKDTGAAHVVERIPFRRRNDQPSEMADMILDDAASLLTKIYFAQAEYYFDTGYDAGSGGPSKDPGQWLWEMSWRARLRRVRLPRDGEQSNADSRQKPSRQEVGACDFEAPAVNVAEACNQAGGGKQCPGNDFLSDLRDFAESMVVH